MARLFWDFFHPDEETVYCHIYNYIGFVLFFLTTAKSIFDLVVTEFYYKDTPLFKLSWRKVFHLLLPFSQITFCLSCIMYNMYCVNISDQEIVNTVITSCGGYILVLCFLINGLHWAFLTSQPESLKFRVAIISVIVLFFVIVPLIFEILFACYQHQSLILYNIHLVELIYASVLNFAVVFVVFISWFILRKHLRELSGLHVINKLIKRTTIQMSCYISFFLVRAGCLLALGLMSGLKEKYNTLRHTFFFISAVLGDIPLTLVMLHFLAHKKHPPTTTGATESASVNEGLAGDSAQLQDPYLSGSPTDNSLPRLTVTHDITVPLYYTDSDPGAGLDRQGIEMGGDVV